ncbi:MAG: hypothetical protein GY853_16390, partial [PVC group bacterium]|nr:hypothetical protein [PVC group bacterium]
TDTAPEGWLLCDGSAINRDDYADLFAVIGETFGDGNNSTTFEIPDFEGRFLRGVDNDAARDPDRATRTAMNPGGNTGDNVGSVQGHAFDSHEHSFDESYWAPGSAAGVWIPGWNGHYTWRNRNTDNMSGGVASSETRPLNAYVNFIIKY